VKIAVTPSAASAVVLSFGQLLLGGAEAASVETPAKIVATQLRAQGYACKSPKSAERDKSDSRPDATVWIVDCGAARYRVRLIPHRAAEVETVTEPK
jgi:hypothetical protein